MSAFSFTYRHFSAFWTLPAWQKDVKVLCWQAHLPPMRSQFSLPSLSPPGWLLICSTCTLFPCLFKPAPLCSVFPRIKIFSCYFFFASLRWLVCSVLWDFCLCGGLALLAIFFMYEHPLPFGLKFFHLTSSFAPGITLASLCTYYLRSFWMASWPSCQMDSQITC